MVSKFTAEILWGPARSGEKIPVFYVLDITNDLRRYVGIPESLWEGVKKGDLVFLTVKLNVAGGIQASSCKKVYSDKVRDVFGE